MFIRLKCVCFAVLVCAEGLMISRDKSEMQAYYYSHSILMVSFSALVWIEVL